MTKHDELISAYAEMAELTLDKCKHSCRVRLQCCSAEYCALTIEIAKEMWGVELTPTGHQRLPLMGPGGCTAAPHLRPLCTLHVCENHYTSDSEFATEYFDLRERINTLESNKQSEGLCR